MIAFINYKNFFHHLPIIIPWGPLRGLRWTLFPYTSYWRGTHEPQVVQAFAQRGLSKGMVIWDVGAHFGFYALWFARLVGTTGEVIAFEPNPKSFDKIQRHQRLNSFKYLKIFQTACGNQDRMQGMVDAGNPTTTAHFLYHDEPLPTSVTMVQERRLDSLAREEELRDPVWIKMDVEGYAGYALEGALECLCRARPSLLIATHSDPEIQHIRSILQKINYQPQNLSGELIEWESLSVGEDYFFINKNKS
jgi:FkbM family methyltransferase